MHRIDPKLQKLILMLSSSSDGEVVNAARALGRLLQNEGHDWHDFVRWVNPEQTPRDNTGNWHTVARWCASRKELLTSREQEFIESLLDWRTTPSSKQMAWLNKIRRGLERR
jgi:hypothetical protein